MWIIVTLIVLILVGGFALWLHIKDKRQNEQIWQEINQLLSYESIPIPTYKKINTNIQLEAHLRLLGDRPGLSLNKLPHHQVQKIIKFRKDYDLHILAKRIQEEADHYLPYLEHMPSVPIRVVEEPIWDENKKKAVNGYVKDNTIVIKRDFYENRPILLNPKKSEFGMLLVPLLVTIWTLKKGLFTEDNELTEEGRNKLKELTKIMVLRSPDYRLPTDEEKRRQGGSLAVSQSKAVPQSIDDPLGIKDFQIPIDDEKTTHEVSPALSRSSEGQKAIDDPLGIRE